MPVPEAKMGEVAPQTPIRTPRINPRLQRYGSPGTVPQAGPKEATMPGMGAGETPPPIIIDNPTR